MRLLPALFLFSVSTGTPGAQIVSAGSTHQKVIALAFDAGSDRGYAQSILHTLEKYRIRATFGMTGLWAKTNPDMVRRMAKDRDTFMNHTYDHRSFTGFSSQAAPLTTVQRTWEMQQADREIRRLTGHSTKPFFRPP